jgi:CheY-like chemotaxis protein
MTVLIVDDEEPIRRLVERILTQAGYLTATASDGPDALRVARALARLDMLVTDMMMPGMDGGELARRLRGDRDGLKVLYVTGWSDRVFEVKRAACPGEAFLEKPFSPQGLRDAVAGLAAGTGSFAAVP